MDNSNTLVETTRVSRSRSLRMSLPRRIAQKLGIEPDDIVGFYSDEKGEIIIRKLS